MKRCFRCGHAVAKIEYAPEPDDDARWGIAATEHHPRCWWTVTRAGKRPLPLPNFVPLVGRPPLFFAEPILKLVNHNVM